MKNIEMFDRSDVLAADTEDIQKWAEYNRIADLYEEGRETGEKLAEARRAAFQSSNILFVVRQYVEYYRAYPQSIQDMIEQAAEQVFNNGLVDDAVYDNLNEIITDYLRNPWLIESLIDANDEGRQV